jgi:hypothetical protein
MNISIIYLVGSVRLLYGIWHVGKYFIWNIRLIFGYAIKTSSRYEVVESKFGTVQEQDLVSMLLQSLSNAGNYLFIITSYIINI